MIVNSINLCNNRIAITLYPIGRPVRATITLYPIGRPVRATITLYPTGRPVRAIITLYPIARVNNIHIEESVLLSNTPVETHSVKL